MNGVKKSAYYHKDIWAWVLKVKKREGFNVSQTLNWILKKAKEQDEK